jgi:hypothetical protein
MTIAPAKVNVKQCEHIVILSALRRRVLVEDRRIANGPERSLALVRVLTASAPRYKLVVPDRLSAACPTRETNESLP